MLFLAQPDITGLGGWRVSTIPSEVAPLTRDKLGRAEIIENIHGKLDVGQKDIHAIIGALIEEIKSALREERTVELRGFGTFEIRTRNGRQRARNPKTGEIVSVPPHGAAVFRPGKELKDIAWPLRNDSQE